MRFMRTPCLASALESLSMAMDAMLVMCFPSRRSVLEVQRIALAARRPSGEVVDDDGHVVDAGVRMRPAGRHAACACAIYGLPAARGMRFGGPFIAARASQAAMKGSSGSRGHAARVVDDLLEEVECVLSTLDIALDVHGVPQRDLHHVSEETDDAVVRKAASAGFPVVPPRALVPGEGFAVVGGAEDLGAAFVETPVFMVFRISSPSFMSSACRAGRLRPYRSLL
jgi:hypothetical protein